MIRAGRRSVIATGILAWVIMLAIGIGDELHQLYTPGRSGADVGDATADALGAAFGIFGILFIYGRRPAKSNLATPGADRPA